jgi:iron complex transport system substrate-binding protein
VRHGHFHRKVSSRGRPRGLVALGVAVAVLATGCIGDAPDVDSGSALRITDASGATLVLPARARRVVSLVPSATETLRAMRVDSVLVGRTDFDTQAWSRSIPSVGGGIEPNLESIVALAPDLVVRFAGEQDPRTPARLDGLGIPHMAVRPDRIEDIYETARLLGEAIGATPAADSLVAAIRAGLDTIAVRVRSLRRLRVAYVLGGTPPWVAGPDTYIDQVVTLLGGDNVFSDLGSLYAPVSAEELRTRQIDVVLLSTRGDFDRSLTPEARIELVGDALEIPGPGVVEAAVHVGSLLHGRSLR